MKNMNRNANNKITVVLTTLYSLLFALILASCSKSDGYKVKLDVDCSGLEPQKLEIVEYNKALFAIDTANFEEGIQAIRPKFQALLGDTLDAIDVMLLKEFVTDTFIMKVNELTEAAFPNIVDINSKVQGVYQHLNYYYPEVMLPPTYTYVSGINYENGPVMIMPEGVVISLDFYLSNNDLVYDIVGMPRYYSRRCQPAALTRDLAEALYYTFIYKDEKPKNVLMEMIGKGKKYYFIEALDPTLNDSILLGYSSQQMDWTMENEGEIWAAVVGNNMLYANGFEQYKVLFNDGPYTAAFSENAPARLGDFLGLQIVRSFMTNNDVTLQDLMEMTDCQDIFQRSQYKPRK